jgi:hypothetical protein
MQKMTTDKFSEVFQAFVIGNKCTLHYLAVQRVPENVYLLHPVSAGVSALGSYIPFRIRNFDVWTDGCSHVLIDEAMFSISVRGNTTWSCEKLRISYKLERANPEVNVWCGVMLNSRPAFFLW